MIKRKKIHRIYNKLGLQPRNKDPRHRVKAELRKDRQEGVGPNDVWAMGFVHDQLAPGEGLSILTTVDTRSRFCAAVDPRFGYRGEDVLQALERVGGRIGYPGTIRVDNGSGFIFRDLDLWAHANDVLPVFSWPDKPTRSGFIEAFDSKLSAEWLNAQWFKSLEDAQEEPEDWLGHDNEDRPKSAIGYTAPIAM